jgi:hypothetical protein
MILFQTGWIVARGPTVKRKAPGGNGNRVGVQPDFAIISERANAKAGARPRATMPSAEQRSEPMSVDLTARQQFILPMSRSQRRRVAHIC